VLIDVSPVFDDAVLLQVPYASTTPVVEILPVLHD
jgi:hypothetical protein